MAFVKSEIFYLVRIEPLLKPQLALPAEQEDKLDHGYQAELGTAIASSNTKQSLPLLNKQSLAVGTACQAELSLLSLSAYAGSLTPLPVPSQL